MISLRTHTDLKHVFTKYLHEHRIYHETHSQLQLQYSSHSSHKHHTIHGSSIEYRHTFKLLRNVGVQCYELYVLYIITKVCICTYIYNIQFCVGDMLLLLCIHYVYIYYISEFSGLLFVL